MCVYYYKCGCMCVCWCHSYFPHGGRRFSKPPLSLEFKGHLGLSKPGGRFQQSDGPDIFRRPALFLPAVVVL